MQNVLYLHDLDTNPDYHETEYLRDLGLTVLAPRIDYAASKGQTSLFNSMISLIRENDISIVIGRGLGGYLAYHLGESYGILSFLIDPELADQSMDLPISEGHLYPTETIIVMDPTLDMVQDTRDYLAQAGNKYTIIPMNTEAANPRKIFEPIEIRLWADA